MGKTKTSLTIKSLVNQPTGFGAFLKGQKLSIICCDDIYFNLEAMRFIFQSLEMSEYCHFVASG